MQVQSSFHCLRLSNFLIRPSLESLQALLILGFVLANDMKAEASWALIGLTCRLAQALGLHRGPHETARLTGAPPPDDLPKRKLWYAAIFSVNATDIFTNIHKVDYCLARQPSFSLF